MTEIIPNGTGAEVRQDINTEFTSLEAEAHDSTIVKLVNSKLPAVDGSLLTNLSIIEAPLIPETVTTSPVGNIPRGGGNGTPFASYVDGTYTAMCAIDGNNCSLSYNYGVTPWQWGYIFSTSQVINGYTLLPMAGVNGAMEDWTFEGSNDTTDGFDGTWTVLDTHANVTSWSGLTTFNFSNTTAYKAYRYNVTLSNNSGGNNHVYIYETDFLSGGYPLNPVQGQVVFDSDLNKLRFYNNSTWNSNS